MTALVRHACTDAAERYGPTVARTSLHTGLLNTAGCIATGNLDVVAVQLVGNRNRLVGHAGILSYPSRVSTVSPETWHVNVGSYEELAANNRDHS